MYISSHFSILPSWIDKGVEEIRFVLHLISNEKLFVNDLSIIQILSKWGKVTRRVIYQTKGNFGRQ